MGLNVEQKRAAAYFEERSRHVDPSECCQSYNCSLHIHAQSSHPLLQFMTEVPLGKCDIKRSASRGLEHTLFESLQAFLVQSLGLLVVPSLEEVIGLVLQAHRCHFAASWHTFSEKPLAWD